MSAASKPAERVLRCDSWYACIAMRDGYLRPVVEVWNKHGDGGITVYTDWQYSDLEDLARLLKMAKSEIGDK